MKTKLFIFALFGLVALAAARPAFERWSNLNQPEFQAVEVGRATVSRVVRATGRVEPVLAVQVGAFVSGPIDELFADFNDTVHKGDMLARIDPRLFQAEVAKDQAVLATAKAEVRRVGALLEQAQNEEKRGLAVQEDNPDFISDSELDQLKFQRLSLEAQLEVAEAGVEQALAELKNSEANLQYTEIRSPVDGVIIDRRVEPGQTVASSFATPVLFVVAPDLAGEIHVFATVDEADIGLVRRAQTRGLRVEFTVDAYPEDVFKGEVKQIRSNSTLVESVVTFPVVVSTTNPETKLLPGMTANLTFRTEVKDDVLCVPNAAIRYFPPTELVRNEDRHLLDQDRMFVATSFDTGDEADAEAVAPPTQDKRHVWVLNGDGKLRAVEVTVGISDELVSELLDGDLDEGDEVVVAAKS